MGKKIKILVGWCILTVLNISVYSQTVPKCYFVTDKASGQVTSGTCVPIQLTMNVEYTFSTAVDTNLVRVLYIWNDGTAATDTVVPIYKATNKFTAVYDHIYPPSTECSYTAQAFIIANGEVCSSSSIQEQTIRAWNTDDLNSGNLFIDPPVAQICEGDTVAETFADQSTFNCNITVEPDVPNINYRWVQFVYNTDPSSSTLIPNASVVDGSGNIYSLTNASGTSVNTQYGPVVAVPDPAYGPNQTSWEIIAPPGAVNGDYIQITMRNWNECNKYDTNAYDGIPPSDTIMGDNPPIETTAYVRIITTPAPPVVPETNTCVNQGIILSASGSTIRWYNDSVKTYLLRTGKNYNPLSPPLSIDNSTSGNYTVYVTDAIGACESETNPVNFNIYDNPTTANAGTNQFLCTDNTSLAANTAIIGTGVWTTSGSAIIADPANPVTTVTNLEVGENTFTWTITNGPCVSSDEVKIFRDLQPAPASAGSDTVFCNNSSLNLNANAPTNNGIGNWSIIQGAGNLIDTTLYNTNFTNINQGTNKLVWRIESAFGGCVTTYDTIEITRDISPDPADAGNDQAFCETSSTVLSANIVTQNGTGTWSVISGSMSFSDMNDPSSDVSNISYTNNYLEWKIESELGICIETRDTVVISRYEMPVGTNAGPDQLLCSVLISDPLSGNIPGVGNPQWNIIGSPFGASPVFSPDNKTNNATLQITSGEEGIYTLEWLINNGLCNAADTVTIDFGIILPPADAGNDTAVCKKSLNLNATAPLAGSGTWSVISGKGSPIFDDIHDPHSLVNISAGEEDVYSFVWTTSSGSCLPLPEHTDTVEIYFKPVPSDPVYQTLNRCGSGTVTIDLNKLNNATTYNWYNDASGSSLIDSDTSFTTPVINNNTRFYYSAYNDTSLCESPLIPFDIYIDPIPGTPISSNMQSCGPDTINLNAIIGLNGLSNRWYMNSFDTIPISIENNFTTPKLYSSASYWVTTYNDSTKCESNRHEVKITIDSIPYLPIASDTSKCGEGSFNLIAQKGLYSTNCRWYDQDTMGVLLTTSDNYITNYLTSSESYFVSSYNDSTKCESDRKEIKATIKPIPDLPIVKDTSICGYDSLTLVSVPGNNGNITRWYNMAGGSAILSTGNIYKTPYLTSLTYYWASTYNTTTGCESSRKVLEVNIKEIPNTTPIQGYQYTRLGQENVVYSVDYHTNSTYNWNIPSTVTKINEVDNFVILGFPQIGSQIISVTETTANGCIGDPKEKEIVVTNEIIEISLKPKDVESCLGDNIFINAVPEGGNAPYFFRWSGDSTYLSDKDIANPVFRASKEGTFKLNIHIWDIDNNHAFDTMTVQINGIPKVSFSENEEYVCAGDNYPISPIITGGSGLYPIFMWSGSTVALSSVSIPNPVFNTFVKNDYQMILTVRDSENCMGRDTILLHNVSPIASFTTDAIPSCSPAEFNFNNKSTDAKFYNWDFDDESSSTDTNTTHTFNNITTSVKYFEVMLTASDEHGCKSKEKTYITIYPNPDHSFSVIPDNGCDPVQAIITSTPGGYSYEWDYGDGVTEISNYSTFHTYRNTGDEPLSYNIKLNATSFFGCTDTFKNEITIYPSPKPDFIATPETQTYPNATVYLANIPEGEYEYSWDFGDGEKSNQMNPLSHTYLYNGNYDIKLKMTGKYCSDSSIVRINIYPAQPVAKFKKVEPGCMPHTVQFENQSLYADSYYWEFGDGAVSNKPNPLYTYYEAGVYKIKLTATNKEGLKSVSSDVGNVYVLPNAFFDLTPRLVFVNDEPVNFFNLSDNGDFYRWDFGDGQISTEFESDHIYTSAGEYTVSLYVMTKDSCYDYFEMPNAVIVEESGKIVFPNVIRPTSYREENRTFKPAVIDEVADDGYDLMIYNRWGELIFESKDRNLGWDGTFNGSYVKSDVYVWKLTGRYKNGRPIDITGDVTIVY